MTKSPASLQDRQRSRWVQQIVGDVWNKLNQATVRARSLTCSRLKALTTWECWRMLTRSETASKAYTRLLIWNVQFKVRTLQHFQDRLHSRTMGSLLNARNKSFNIIEIVKWWRNVRSGTFSFLNTARGASRCWLLLVCGWQATSEIKYCDCYCHGWLCWSVEIMQWCMNRDHTLLRFRHHPFKVVICFYTWK